MAINFPTSIDSLTNPLSTDYLNSPSHAAQHANANDIIEALEAKVGINSSAVTTSLDYKINNAISGTASGITGKTTPTGALVGTTDTQILTNKEISTGSFLDGSADPNLSYMSILRQGIVNGGMEVSTEDVAATKSLVKDTAKYACDLFSVLPTGTLVSAGTQAQIVNSTIGHTGKALKLAGVTLTGSGSIKIKHRIEALNAVKFKNLMASFSQLHLQDTGGSLNYTIQINKANSADNFSAVTQIAISGNLAVASGASTLIKLENVSMGDCSNGIEIVTTIPCGAITTKNFETTEWQMNQGAYVLPFIDERYEETLFKVRRMLYVINSRSLYSKLGVGYTKSTTRSVISFFFPVRLRIIPTPTVSGAFSVLDAQGGQSVTSSGTDMGGDDCYSMLFDVASGLTAYRPAVLQSDNSTSSYISFDSRFTA